MFCTTHLRKQVENAQNQTKKLKAELVFQKCAKEEDGESPPKQLPGPKHRHRRGLGPATSPPTKGDGQASQLGCGHVEAVLGSFQIYLR
jgi:hypothetical protein